MGHKGRRAACLDILRHPPCRASVGLLPFSEFGANRVRNRSASAVWNALGQGAGVLDNELPQGHAGPGAKHALNLAQTYVFDHREFHVQILA